MLGDQQQQEQQQAFARRLIELARMPRHRPAAGKHHGPRDVGFPAVQLTVDEVGEAAEEQPDRDRLGDDVGKGEDRKAAGAGHPAMPQIERLERVLEVVAGLVEQHIADPPAEHDAERRPYQEIVDVAALDETRRRVRQ